MRWSKKQWYKPYHHYKATKQNATKPPIEKPSSLAEQRIANSPEHFVLRLFFLNGLSSIRHNVSGCNTSVRQYVNG